MAIITTNVGAARRPGARPSPPPKQPGWGWLEWMTLAQTAIPALLFVPGLGGSGPLRTATRVGFYALVILAWATLTFMGRPRPGGVSYPPRPWLLFCCGYLALSLFHPQTNSPLSGLAQLTLDIVILSPAFWAANALVSPRQIPRIMAIAFVANALSALVGLGQIYQPERFNPPAMVKSEVDEHFGKLTTDAGVEVFRPFGLTDSPGGAAVAGQAATIIGLCWALAPIAAWKRLACAGLAIMGLAVIYFTQIRSALIITILCLIAILVIFVMQRDFRRAMLLGVGGSLVVVGAFTWAMAVMGNTVGARIATLFEDDPTKVYQSNRGRFVEYTFNEVLPDSPLGSGLGRWGMMYQYFGDKGAPRERQALWAEVQLTGWAYDGGFPLIIAYLGATALALADSLRIALRSKDRDLAFWAAVITASNFSVLTLVISYPIFVSPGGVQFWLLSAALHAADRRVTLDSAATPSPPRRPPGPRRS